ncbi:unnamed protein product [Peniophora sp. CBMAI 1063]|nr:unnamed protein product [Peniophora sp. CBMAI 1063]
MTPHAEPDARVTPEADANAHIRDWLRALSADISSESPNELDIDALAKRVDQAKDEADRDSRTVYLRVPTFVNGQDVVQLFDNGAFGKSHRLTIIGDEVFVKLLPSACAVVWPTLLYRFLRRIESAAGCSEVGLDPENSTRKVMHSRHLGIEIAREPSGALCPSSVAEYENYCPSVLVEIGTSDFLEDAPGEKDWWVYFSEQSTHGKLGLIILISLSKPSKSLTITLCPAPSFTPHRTLTLPFDGALPDTARLEFEADWLYGGERPEWFGRDGEEGRVVLRREDLEVLRAAVGRRVFPMRC